jgi:hypothetical protein
MLKIRQIFPTKFYILYTKEKQNFPNFVPNYFGKKFTNLCPLRARFGYGFYPNPFISGVHPTIGFYAMLGGYQQKFFSYLLFQFFHFIFLGELGWFYKKKFSLFKTPYFIHISRLYLNGSIKKKSSIILNNFLNTRTKCFTTRSSRKYSKRTLR